MSITHGTSSRSKHGQGVRSSHGVLGHIAEVFYVTSGSDRNLIHGLSADGDKKWTGKANVATIQFPQQISYRNEKIYLACDDDDDHGGVWVFDHAGVLINSFFGPQFSTSGGIDADSDGNIYKGEFDVFEVSGLQKLDSEGNTLWSSLIDADNAFRLRLDSDGDIVLVGGGVWKLNPANGATIWGGLFFGGAPNFYWDITLDEDDNAYVTNTKATMQVRKIDTNGNSLWQKNPAGVGAVGVGYDPDGFVYVGAGLSIYKLSAATGNTVDTWDTPVDGQTPFSFEVVSDGIYVAFNGFPTTKISRADGSVIWQNDDIFGFRDVVAKDAYNLLW